MEPFKSGISYQNSCRIAARVVSGHPDFSIAVFVRGLEMVFEPLELKQRMHRLATPT